MGMGWGWLARDSGFNGDVLWTVHIVVEVVVAIDDSL